MRGPSGEREGRRSPEHYGKPSETPPPDATWRQLASCRAESTECFFSYAEEEEALQICEACIVRTECLAYALDERVEHGVYGGSTARWRKELLARCSDVPSWHIFLRDAKQKYLSNAMIARRGAYSTSAGSIIIRP